MEQEKIVEESVAIEAAARDVYAAVSDPRRMREWSPEVFAAWVRGRAVAQGTRFVGFNRIGWRVWFTTCQVTAAVPGEVFAFRVTSFGLPVAVWGYRVEDVSAGPSAPRTRLTEYWEDQRRDGRIGALFSTVAGMLTSVPSERRPAHNRAAMRATLDRIKATVEKG